ncbi:uncharacterized protein A4U43_C04F29150 [Asparagus officinalis]|uniref:CUE domain-containing protein n=1 Tax=Asparagus officinalis TaxID=4686 RepID=A0A5P1F4F7_ASPOF|nr:uncharacterized protein A4U43_C04F29150 [Asparagus officinalis]
MMRIIENPKCIRNFTSQPTISSIPSASRHQPAMTLLQVRELLAKNREEYDELLELEKKLISGSNCGNDEEDDEFVWQSITRLDVYHLLIGSAISDSLVDCMIERFKMKIETDACSKHVHITGSFFAILLDEWDHDNGDSSSGLLNDSLNEQIISDDASVNPVEYLASVFPGFAAESLADIYYANGCDLNLTVEILTQYKLLSTTFKSITFCEQVYGTHHLGIENSIAHPINYLLFMK